MRLSGLSNQWKTIDVVRSQFTCDQTDDDPALDLHNQMIHDLLDFLLDQDGPCLYIGTSLSQLNFNTRDAYRQFDSVPSFATVHIRKRNRCDETLVYSVGYRLIHRRRPTSHWTQSLTSEVQVAGMLVLNALAYADIPQRPDPKPTHSDCG